MRKVPMFMFSHLAVLRSHEIQRNNKLSPNHQLKWSTFLLLIRKILLDVDNFKTKLLSMLNIMLLEQLKSQRKSV